MAPEKDTILDVLDYLYCKYRDIEEKAEGEDFMTVVDADMKATALNSIRMDVEEFE